MSKRFKILAFILALLLAACGGQPATTSSNVSNQATSPPQSQSGQSGATFAVGVTGDESITLSQSADKVDFFKIPNEGAGYSLSFTRGDMLINVQILFYSSTPPQSGNYTFSLDVVDGSVTAGVYDQSSSTPRSFTLAQGTLTLELNNGLYSGTFQFSSKGGEAGSQDQSVTVSGSFSGIQLRT
jgi:hypothetical protein